MMEKSKYRSQARTGSAFSRLSQPRKSLSTSNLMLNRSLQGKYFDKEEFKHEKLRLMKSNNINQHFRRRNITLKVTNIK